MTHEIERADAIRWIRIRMCQYGVTLNDLKAAGCFAVIQRQVRYRNAQGQCWDGQGAMPDWLNRAVNAGQSPEFFLVEESGRT
ncbi:H-NS family nucleoid-associated regulatory protein [Cupriavidus necator]